ncbi:MULTISPECIES: succinic semialdehyde dehydrogenase [Cryobacterium]|uniref:Aldehyde dehydrogenase family protein n=1 Tax=Cryobacterium breve TaxID=1259258 RepID=A0ABY2J342_9MICO|nr:MULTISPECIES: succinic semialdehyde dehydrogenase [Cryobacterium]TFC91036.1 aldehyde dehydrogenase family protein [Cryobacterium sp. TmT3-12]TFC99355.1 aldehyde dehydrogenase family protein [Cryobacterium breve]
MPASPLDPAVITNLTRSIRSTTGATVTVIAPFTGEVLHELPVSGVTDVQESYAQARLAQLAWARAGFARRRAILLRAHDLILERTGLLQDTVQAETGKTRGQAFEEVFQAAGVTRFNALAARGVLRGGRRRSAIPLVITAAVSYRPKGVAGVITPWNYPLSLAAMDVVPALAAGCGVVQKADDQGALSILSLRQAFIDAGVPEQLWAVVAGDGAEIGGMVTEEADYVCFTGSTATGKRVAAQAAGNLTGVSLELGGKNPLIVLDDVDPARAAADAAPACFTAMGQLCVSIERIFVQRGVADAFLREFVAVTRSLKLGAAYDYSTDVGCLTSQAQLDRVSAQVADAVTLGATIEVGGRARPDLGPFFYEPTVLTGVTAAMECFAGETFGPVVAVTVFDSEQEAILAANDSDYGLNASVFSGSVRRALRVSGALEAGSVNINEGYRGSFSSVAAPMGGLKQSGLGRRNGPEGLLRFVDAITIARATGLIPLPRTGRDFERLAAPMLLLAAVLKGIRRR